jgi:hypothetical protein
VPLKHFMKQKLIIGLSILLLGTVVFLISRDLFSDSGKTEKNPCEYNLDKLKAIDTSLIKYKEVKFFKPGMSKLTGIAIDNQRVYIAGTSEIKAFDKQWKQVLNFKTDSTANCIAVGPQKEIYLGFGSHVEKYDSQGKKLKTWEAYGRKSVITSIAVNNNQVFVADAGSRLVLHYDADGNLQNIIGKRDKSKGIEGLIVPSLYLDVVIGSFNDIWIVNPGKHQLENYTENGELRSSWGVPSMQLEGFAGCCNPIHFAILPNSYFVTYEKGLDRIKLYNQAGKFDCVVAEPQSFGGKSEYHCSFATLVNDLAVDAEGRIYVLDATSNGVRVFERK